MEKQYYVVKRSDDILSHAAEGEERDDHKYVARIAVGTTKSGNTAYRYFYTNEEYQAYLNGKDPKSATTGASVNSLKDPKQSDKSSSQPPPKNEKFSFKNLFSSVSENIEKTIENGKNKVNNWLKDTAEKIESEAPKLLNKAVDKAFDIGKELYDDEDNMYDVKATNYDDKLLQIAKSDEWKAIVQRKDKEYVRKNSDGSTSYLIDDYLAKKKNPILDVLDDIISGREITVNKIEPDAVIAGVKEKIIGTVMIGMTFAGVVTKALIEKSKLSQGTYQEEIEELSQTIIDGKRYVDDFTGTVSKLSTDDIMATIDMVQTTARNAESANLGEVSKAINEDNVLKAAQILMSSEAASSAFKNSDTFTEVKDIMSNLSDDELALLSALLNNVKKR